MSSQNATMESAARFANGAAANLQQSTREVVENHPIPTGLFVFAAGLAAGTLVGCALAAGSRQSSTSVLAENVGSRVLESLSSLVPDALSKSMGR